MAETVKEQIDELGGAERVAEAIGRTVNNVRVWSARNRLPRQVWPELVEAFPRKITLAKLKRLEGFT